MTYYALNLLLSIVWSQEKNAISYQHYGDQQESSDIKGVFLLEFIDKEIDQI